MDKLTVETKILEIAQRIEKHFKPQKIILFGSFAWGNPTPDSDVDFFIIKESANRRIDREREVQGLLWGCGVPVDTIVYTPEEIKRRLEIGDSFIADIMNKGKVLYSAS